MKKDILEKLCPPDEAELEKLAESSPATDDKTKKRIVGACLRKCGAYGDSVEGAERYRRPGGIWAAAAAAALVLAAAGGIAAIRLSRSSNGVGVAPETETQNYETATASSEDELQSKARKEEEILNKEIEEAAKEASRAKDAEEEATSEEIVFPPVYQEEASGDGAPATKPGEDAPEAPASHPEKATQPPTEAATERSVEDEQSATEPWVIHLPCNAYLPYGYWSSTGVHGNMNWEFFAGKAQTYPDEAGGGRGSCYKDGYLVGSFGYSSAGDAICIQMDDGTYMKGTISGMAEGPTAPFQITWDTGGVDYFTNSKEPFTYYPVEPNDQTAR